jgi:hypothetical protein
VLSFLQKYVNAAKTADEKCDPSKIPFLNVVDESNALSIMFSEKDEKDQETPWSSTWLCCDEVLHKSFTWLGFIFFSLF